MTVAGALKLFSANNLTKKLYRRLGNTAGAKRRVQAGLPRVYVERASDIIAKVRKYDIIKPGDKLLELGTGWLHWESTVLRLFYDVEVSLFDVWDNRQFSVFQRYFAEFATIIDREIEMKEPQRARAHSLLGALARAKSFEDVYGMLGHRYIVNPKGTLDMFPDDYFSFVFSCSVLEHIHKDIVASVIRGLHRVLRPGGYSFHVIDLSDHLAHYDEKKVSLKNYLRYSDAVWRAFFQNDVQYFNRVQRPEWLVDFEQAGFALLGEQRNTVDLTGVKIAGTYTGLSHDDLACLAMNVVHRKSG